MKDPLWTLVPLLILATACARSREDPSARGESFKDDVAFLEAHTGWSS